MIDASPVTLAAQWDRVANVRGAKRLRSLLALDSDDARDYESWTIGRCETKLASIYRTLFGDAVEATVRCRACDETLEFETTVGALFGAEDATSEAASASDLMRIVRDGFDVIFRPLLLRDVLTMPTTLVQARAHLIACAVLEARRDDRKIAIDALPESLCAAIGEAIRTRDAHAETTIALVCASCGWANDVPFDMGAFLWEALDRRVARTFADVHALARAYGWSEDTILALPEARRQRYLELLAS
ncbi:MAG: hypothetical protein NVS2B8_17600 [Vulcanimicrobiaceae bacterium]